MLCKMQISTIYSQWFKDYVTLNFPKQKILDSFKLKEFVDDNFKVGENGGKFFKQIENTVG